MPRFQTNGPNQIQRVSVFPPVNTNNIFAISTQHGDHHDYGLDNHTQNGYGMDLNPAHVTAHIGNTMITNINVGNVTLNGLGATNANFQQDIGEQNLFDPSNIVANDIEGSDPNEWKYWDAFVDYNPMGDLFQNPTSPSATLPNEYGSSKDIGGPVFKNSKFPDE
ncbi:hypothetical protein R3W88_032780 [Solanum pinnatisectum]|uniref:Uncharacterized protein n=1 Tax=Solanum pinnatisectum TaxID=50273 RepID=A0AAV9LQS1_9SOLN|nr:hypothetical protein R3W88_032780 [Solanum pinnatisectum]